MSSRSLALFLAVPVALLSACGGGGGGGGPSGTFLDSAVAGLDYNTSAGSLGTTDANGRFRYEAEGVQVTFFVGDIVVGIAPGAAVLTPLDLVAFAIDETDDEVTNIARFLQTIDLDLDPSNGIEIPEAVRTAAVGVTIDFSQSIANFEATEQAKVSTITAGLPGGSRTLIPAMDAQEHLGDTLRRNVAGRYDGRFAGDDAGPFHVFVDREGTLYGWAISPFDGLIGLSGGADIDGGFLAGNASTGATFSGTIEPDGTLAGDWDLGLEGGTFEGRRTIAVDAGLDGDLVEMLAGTYTGTATVGGQTDAFTALFDTDGNLMLPPPDDHVAGTIVATSGTSASFVALTDEGDVIQGTVTLAGQISGTIRNDEQSENGTFSGMLQ